ncbi:vesicle-associated membrane protein 7 [Homalodisca vitripennis]|uniref:Vesicle-associated membrane protein 7 n=1 Tax=Homalodisca liturata TaxID=320908 RepID=A0A1B6I2Y0_9HEMI|nr:vesicle-associated membrane protein 7 [Homalodisca vitripennis]
MPILYSVVARGTTVLAKYASCPGNFAEVTDQILTKIPPENGKLTLSHGSYLFHYICEDRIVYMCITDDEFERSRAFLYLNEIKRRFKSTYGKRSETAIAYAMNTEFSPILNNEMKHYSESRDIDAMSRVHGELDELKDIMVRNIDNVAMRGEKLELLVNKAENLSASSVTFRSHSRNLQRSMFWKNIKLYLIIGGIATVIIYIIISMSCGWTWSACFSSS